MGGNPAYFDGTYRETLALLVEAQEYFLNVIEKDAHAYNLNDRLNIVIEMRRITSRLIMAMGWLLTERAVYNGELPMDALKIHDLPYSRIPFFTDHTSADNRALPQKLRSLLDRSLQIYCRVIRLDEMVHLYSKQPT